MVFISPHPLNVNFVVVLARHVTSLPQNVLHAISIIQDTDIFLKISASKAVHLNLLMLGLSAKNAMQSAAHALTILHSVFLVTRHLSISSSLAMTAWKSVQRGPSQIIKD